MDFSMIYMKQSLSEMAVVYIKNKILSGEFKSGDKLIESDISKSLGISRAPVREAMRELNIQGMIVFSPRKGNYVLATSLKEIMEVFDIRISLEVKMLELIVEGNLLSGQDFDFLYDLTEKMRILSDVDLEQHEKIYQLNICDLKFHNYLWDASKSLVRKKIIEGLFFQLLIAMNQDLITLGTFQEKSAEHLRIIEALEKKDVESAITHFRVHLDNYMQAAYTLMAKEPSDPADSFF